MSEYSDGVDPGEADPRLGEPGSEGQPGTFDDSVDNLPGSQRDPKMEDSKIDPEAPISSAKGEG
ncbi:MAG: hypothetical protein HKN03_17990 [Acidimicrobiales bacterium]|nr:hypothetical protein [Acidimicrobiales bacterium]